VGISRSDYLFSDLSGLFTRASRPSDFSYKHDAKHNSMFMTAKAWDDTDDDAFIQELSEVLNSAKACPQVSHPSRLRTNSMPLPQPPVLRLFISSGPSFSVFVIRRNSTCYTLRSSKP